MYESRELILHFHGHFTSTKESSSRDWATELEKFAITRTPNELKVYIIIKLSTFSEYLNDNTLTSVTAQLSWILTKHDLKMTRFVQIN